MRFAEMLRVSGNKQPDFATDDIDDKFANFPSNRCQVGHRTGIFVAQIVNQAWRQQQQNPMKFLYVSEPLRYALKSLSLLETGIWCLETFSPIRFRRL